MAMTFSPRMEAMLADWEQRIKSAPAPVLTAEDRARMADVRRAMAWTQALKSGDAISANRYLAEYEKRGW